MQLKLGMKFKRLIRILKYKLNIGPKEIVYTNYPFSESDMKALMDSDYCISLCNYDDLGNSYLIILRQLDNEWEC